MDRTLNFILAKIKIGIQNTYVRYCELLWKLNPKAPIPIDDYYRNIGEQLAELLKALNQNPQDTKEITRYRSGTLNYSSYDFLRFQHATHLCKKAIADKNGSDSTLLFNIDRTYSHPHRELDCLIGEITDYCSELIGALCDSDAVGDTFEKESPCGNLFSELGEFDERMLWLYGDIGEKNAPQALKNYVEKSREIEDFIKNGEIKVHAYVFLAKEFFDDYDFWQTKKRLSEAEVESNSNDSRILHEVIKMSFMPAQIEFFAGRNPDNSTIFK